MDGRLVGSEAIAQMRLAYLHAIERKGVGHPGYDRGGPGSLVYGVLIEDLAAPASLYSTPTSALMHRLAREGEVGTNLSLAGGVITAETQPVEHYVRVWNHDPNLTKSTGDPVKCGWILGELMVLDAGSGGAVGNEWIDFTVYQLCPAVPDQAIQAAWATVIGTSCQSSVSIGDIVLVWDTRGCWFDVPVELLSTFSGRADLAAAEPYEEVLFCAVWYSLYPCYWKVTQLCCTEESY